MTKISQHALYALLFSLLISACTEGNRGLHKYIGTVKNRLGAPIEALPVLAPRPVFTFSQHDTRRSPFKPVKQKDITPYVNPQRKKEPLEAYPLNALKFVGILKEKQRLWALISDPNKKIVPLIVGNYIGLNHGQITSIKDNKIKLEETVKKLGHWKKHKVTMFMDFSK